MYSFFQQRVISLILLNLNDPNKVTELIKVLTEINKEILFKENFLLDIITKIYNRINTENYHIMESSQKLLKENSSLKNLVSEKSKENILLEQDRQLLKEKCSILNNENEIMTSKILDNRKINKEEEKSYNNNSTLKKSLTSTNSQKKVAKFSEKYDKEKIKLNTPNNRKFTKETLLDLINEIYKSKKLANKKYMEIKRPLPTMEQHMYTFLNQKYGLKNITVEVASEIIKGIKDFSPYNNEICLFGLILRNELEENSIDILWQIKKVVSEQIFYIIRDNNPLKTLSEIESTSEEMKNNLIDEDVWKTIIVKLFYNDEKNLEYAMNQVYNFIDKIIRKSNSVVDTRKMTREEKTLMDDVQNYPKKIAYKDFVNIIIGVHIQLRTKFLQNFRNAFKACDTDRNGILNKEEFYKLIIDLKIFPNDNSLEKNIDNLVVKIRNCETYDSFSFSEIVDLLDKEKILFKDNTEASLLEIAALVK